MHHSSKKLTRKIIVDIKIWEATFTWLINLNGFSGLKLYFVLIGTHYTQKYFLKWKFKKQKPVFLSTATGHSNFKTNPPNHQITKKEVSQHEILHKSKKIWDSSRTHYISWFSFICSYLLGMRFSYIFANMMPHTHPYKIINNIIPMFFLFYDK
jgi:hypothetical protein